jgi:hypothetical protein
MWLATTFIAAFIATFLRIILKNKYKLGFLSLMLWGAAIMMLVDHILGYEGGAFLESKTDGLITDGITLGAVMLLPVLLIWSISLKKN